jgi:DNA replication ATP-dependent helicase Dna2
LAAHGKRVLITSYTHAAVDNLMIKLIEKGVSNTGIGCPISLLARIGHKSACHPFVHPVLVPEIASSRESWGSESASLPSADSLHSVMSSARIVGVSALTIPRSPLLVGQNFDIVIVDEAGQISQPAILGALMAADAFVLVGDHMQLPPLVNSEIADKGGLGISMLRRLADKHPGAVAQLTFQYRMHEQICNLCNEIVYEGKLRCATEKVKHQRLCLSGFPSALPLADRWLTNIVNPSRPVVFIDTDPSIRTNSGLQASPIVGLERCLGKQGRGNIVNDVEARIVCRIVDGLLACGVPASSIGVISPFRAQLRIFEDIPGMARWREAGLEASTIDRYQGRDKEVIVISFVRSNPKGKAGRLLEDFRRLNVAVSRAKCKLIMVGSYSTLHRGSEVLRPILDGLLKRNQVQHVPDSILR